MLAVASSPSSVFDQLAGSDVDAFLVEVSAAAANGAARIEAARGARPSLLIIVVLERGDEASRSRALAAGADAHLFLEALSRSSILHAIRLAIERREIETLVSRTSERPRKDAPLRFAGFELDAPNLVLSRDGRPVAIHRTPLRLLIHLLRNAGRSVSRQELIDNVWSGVAVGDCAVASALRELRRALGDDGARQRLIETRRGIGHRFVGEISEAGGDRGVDE